MHNKCWFVSASAYPTHILAANLNKPTPSTLYSLQSSSTRASFYGGSSSSVRDLGGPFWVGHNLYASLATYTLYVLRNALVDRGSSSDELAAGEADGCAAYGDRGSDCISMCKMFT